MSNNTRLHQGKYDIIIDGEKYRHIINEYASISNKDKISLRAFFEKYKHLTNNQLARILSRSNILIRKLKHSCGIVQKSPNHRPKDIGLVPSKVELKEYTYEEIEKLLETHSVLSISKTMGIGVKTLYNRLKAKGIYIKTYKERVKSNNPCCNYHWLYTNYIINGYSVHTCAKMAGVYPQTISAWLVKYKIPMINRSGSSVAWVRDTLKELSIDKDNVKEVRLNSKKIVISYYGVLEHYYYNSPYLKKRFKHFTVNEESFTINKTLKLKPIWYQDMGTNDTNLRLEYKDLKKANLIETRVAINKYANHQMKRGYSRIYASKEAIKDNLERIKYSTMTYKINDHYVQMTNRHGLVFGKLFLLRFYDYSENYRELYSKKRKMHHAICCLLKRRKCHIDDISIQCLYPKYKWFDYYMLAKIFEDNKIYGSMLDISPHNQGLILTAERMQCPYYYPHDNMQHENAINEGAKDFLTIDYLAHTDQKVDYIIANYQYHDVDFNQLKKSLSFGRRFIAICDDNSRQSLMNKMNPKKIIEFKKSMTMHKNETILIY